jgi:hypothetical protein
MRYSVLASLVAMLGLAAAAPVANVVCDPGPVLDAHKTNTNKTIEDLGALAGEVNNCIERFCANEEKGDSECGSVTLAAFGHDGSLPNMATCVDQLRRILNHCVATEGVVTGEVKTDKALFEIYMHVRTAGLDSRELSIEELEGLELVEDVHNQEGGKGDGFEKRRRDTTVSNIRKGSAASTSKKGTKSKSKETKLTKSNTGVQTKTKTNPNPTTTSKANSNTGLNTKTNTSPGSTTTSKANPKPHSTTEVNSQSTSDAEETPRACALKGKGTKSEGTQSNPGTANGKKTVGNGLSGRAPTPDSDCEKDPKDIYHYRILNRADTARHHVFKSNTNWKDYRLPTATRSRVTAVLEKMPLKGKLDVIVMKNAHTSIINAPNGGPLDPRRSENGRGDYLLTNGGFFIMPPYPANSPEKDRATLKYDYNSDRFDQEKYQYYTVGQTNASPKFVPVPPSQSTYYRQLVGTDGTSLWSGPTIKQELDLTQPALKFASPYAGRVVGGVHTSSEPNERLAYVVLNDRTKLIFVYTADDRFTDGCTMNQLRTVIDTYLAKFHNGARIADTRTALNLDGGGSIYVSFNEQGMKPRIIALGSRKMSVPKTVSSVREVANLIKFTV